MPKNKVTPIRRSSAGDAKAAVVDELGRLGEEIAGYKPWKERSDQLRAKILSWYEESPAEESFVVEGQTHTVVVSERSRARRIRSMPKLFKRLGEKLFLELATFALKHVDDHIPVTERKAYLSEARTGSRKLKCVAKAVEKAA